MQSGGLAAAHPSDLVILQTCNQARKLLGMPRPITVKQMFAKSGAHRQHKSRMLPADCKYSHNLALTVNTNPGCFRPTANVVFRAAATHLRIAYSTGCNVSSRRNWLPACSYIP